MLEFPLKSLRNIFKMIKNKLLRILSFFIFPACVFVFSKFIDMAFDAYVVFPWVDIPMHFLGGISIAYTSFLFLRYFKEEGFISINRKFLHVLFVVSLVALVAVLWEFYEFLQFYFFGIPTQPSVADTMLDLFVGLIGAAFGSFVFRNK